MTAPVTTRSSGLVLRALERRGGIGAEDEILEIVGRLVGQREAECAVGLACIGGRVARCQLPDGRAGLRLVEGER